MKKITNRGFSIIEMIVYAGLLVLFLAVLSNLFLSSLDIKKSSEGDSFLGQDARFIVSRLNYDIQRADSITSPNLGASANALTLSIGGVSYIYALSSTNLTLTDGAGTYNLNSSETTVSNVTFQRIGNVNGKNSIKVSYSINGNSYVTTMGTR